MKRLARDTINTFAHRFVDTSDDQAKQDAVDQLGAHPVNHAEFIDQLNALTGGHNHTEQYAIYLDCVRWLGWCNVVVDNS